MSKVKLYVFLNGVEEFTLCGFLVTWQVAFFLVLLTEKRKETKNKVVEKTQDDFGFVTYVIIGISLFCGSSHIIKHNHTRTSQK